MYIKNKILTTSSLMFSGHRSTPETNLLENIELQENIHLMKRKKGNADMSGLSLKT